MSSLQVHRQGETHRDPPISNKVALMLSIFQAGIAFSVLWRALSESRTVLVWAAVGLLAWAAAGICINAIALLRLRRVRDAR